MKSTIIATIGGCTIIALVVGTLLYQPIFNQNCLLDEGKITGFLKCSRTFEDFISEEDMYYEMQPESEINRACMTIEQSKEIAPFFKTPTYLPEGYSYVCSRSGMPFESYIVYYNQEFPNNWQIPELVSDGAIFIYQIDERNFVGNKEFETYGSAEQRIRETYDDVMKNNPSLNPQLITINEMLAYAVDSCPDCGIQTANFPDGTVIQESTSTKTRIKFIDENGVKYMLETTLPLNELIPVAESLQ